ncbi:hypothetical protein [Martelella endophytica]|uniref:hypothetical protein n=1 Tax=Martelella endophytica TaxID=1486262 RepID=UPI00130E6A67|nr:hypothetical protein [Martelella endophytica]
MTERQCPGQARLARPGQGMLRCGEPHHVCMMIVKSRKIAPFCQPSGQKIAGLAAHRLS